MHENTREDPGTNPTDLRIPTLTDPLVPALAFRLQLPTRNSPSWTCNLPSHIQHHQRFARIQGAAHAVRAHFAEKMNRALAMRLA